MIGNQYDSQPFSVKGVIYLASMVVIAPHNSLPLSNLEVVGMGTLVLLESTKKQMAFLGEIMEKRLLMVLESKHPLILHVVRKILGSEFLWATHKCKVNLSIPTMFLSICIQMSVCKPITKKVCQMIFRNSFLGEINAVLDNIDDQNHIPLAHQYYMTQDAGGR